MKTKVYGSALTHGANETRKRSKTRTRDDSDLSPHSNLPDERFANDGHARHISRRDSSLPLLIVERRRSGCCLSRLSRVGSTLYRRRSRGRRKFRGFPRNSSSSFCCTVIRVSHSLLRSVANKSYMCFCNICHSS